MQGGNFTFLVALPAATLSPFGCASLLGEQMWFAHAQNQTSSKNLLQQPIYLPVSKMEQLFVYFGLLCIYKLLLAPNIVLYYLIHFACHKNHHQLYLQDRQLCFPSTYRHTEDIHMPMLHILILVELESFVHSNIYCHILSFQSLHCL